MKKSDITFLAEARRISEDRASRQTDPAEMVAYVRVAVTIERAIRALLMEVEPYRFPEIRGAKCLPK